ncbi:CAZyme family GH76 [Penicillium riverlandense]|uniref:CAZyme family GH76 n=1 Tax=Penicillium riverlandense TaxID=1903569 RepID=UPI00254909A4|nr:CAZyme family GH76 [Penicillium riverlandense]KAJ5826052.1 CAZyme family GH76 [Penicillium riverlandense]
MFFSPNALVATVLGSLLIARGTLADDPTQRAETALSTLQKWYNSTSGLWDTCGWWNGANCMTVIADLAAVDSSVMNTATHVFKNTFQVAPRSNPNPSSQNTRISRRSRRVISNAASSSVSQWLDGANDDDGWWALAWIAAYDVTNEPSYLELAEGIFSSLSSNWGTNCGNGGIYWSTTSNYVNSITNELFLSIAAHLANRVPANKDQYIDWAQKQWNWFAAQGFVNKNGTINDGLTSSCQNNGQTIWSYNQGVVLGGLVELNKAAPNSSYLNSASRIATAAIKTLADSNMVIHETCEPNSCEPNGTQFKGIFIRNLQMLQSVAPNSLYKQVIDSCANSISENDQNSQKQFGVDWSGPVTSVDASTHSSAMDALVAAISF